jgi:hypothetical protein
MRGLFFGLSVLVAISSTCIAGESIYLSTTLPLEEFREVIGLDGAAYAFVAPYFTKVRMAASISISKVTSGNSTNPTSSQSKTSMPSAPSVNNASWNQNQIKYAVSCDLTSVLKPADHDKITITGSNPPGYDTTDAEVQIVRPDAIFITAPDPGKPYLGGATFKGGITCPSPESVNGFSVNVTLNTLPYGRAYLYLRQNAFFSDSINVSVDSNGLMAGSDSSSVQQITAILTELGQTVGSILNPMNVVSFKEGQPPPPPAPPATKDPRQICYSAISNLLKSGPFYQNLKFQKPKKKDSLGFTWTWQSTEPMENGVTLVLTLKTLTESLGDVDLFSAENETTGIDRMENQKPIHLHNGLIAFFPVPARAAIYCVDGDNWVLLNAPTVVNLYAKNQYLDPQRDFFTGPQDSLTFSNGFIVGHKYSDQSSAKTVVDAVTAPVRALFPSVSVQQTTQVQTGGGKPDQTTTTTQTTTGPPKSQ